MYKDGKLSTTLAESILGLDEMVQNVQIKLSDQFLNDEKIKIHQKAIIDTNSFIYKIDLNFVSKTPGFFVEQITGLFTERKKN